MKQPRTFIARPPAPRTGAAAIASELHTLRCRNRELAAAQLRLQAREAELLHRAVKAETLLARFTHPHTVTRSR